MKLLEARKAGWVIGDRRIVDRVDLTVREGECLGLLGPNGAGKTSLLRLLAGLEGPSTGEVLLDGRPLASWSSKARARRVAYVPQLSPVQVPLDVHQLMLSARYPYLSARQLAPAAGDFAAVRQAAHEVGIESLLKRRLTELSGGERQSAYVAAALAQRSPILLLDEPTTHLDAGNRRRVAELLLALGRKGRHTLVVATHDLRFAARLCDRLVAMREGALVAEGTPAQVLTPEVLGDLFDAPFRVWRDGGEVLPVLELDSEESA